MTKYRYFSLPAFPTINYPPGTLNDPNAPWNQVDIIGDCFSCGESKLASDMSKEEIQSYDDNDDGSFLCDHCANEMPIIEGE